MPRTEKDLSIQMDTSIRLLQHLLALQLFDRGVPKSDIAKHLRLAKSSVVKMLKGIKEKE